MRQKVVRLGSSGSLLGLIVQSCTALNAASLPVPVSALAFQPDGSRLLVSRHQAIQVYDPVEKKPVTSLACAFPKISSLAFARHGSLLLVAGGTPGASGGVQLFAWPAGRLVQSLTHRTDLTTSVAVNPAGDRVALGGADHQLELLRLDPAPPRLSRLQLLADHSRPVLAAAFSPDGRWLITASADRSIKVWAADSGKLQRSFSHHTDSVNCLAFRPPTLPGIEPVPWFCASGSDDATVRVWQPDLGRMVRIIRGHDGPVFAIAYSRDGTRLFSAGKEGVIRVIDADSDGILHRWSAHDDWIYALALSPEGSLLASGDFAGDVKLWHVNGPKISPAGLLR